MVDETETETEVPPVANSTPRKGTRRVKSNLHDLEPADVVSAQDEKDARLEVADREAIDNIVLSSDVSKGGKIRITRKGPLDHTFQYVTTVPADAWDTESSFEFIKKTYGGGDYKCQTFRANGQLYKPFEFSIDYRIKGALDEDEIKRMAMEQQGQMSRTTQSDMFKMFDLLRDKPSDGLKSSDMIKMMEMSSQKSDQMMMLMMNMMSENSKNMVGMMTVMMSANKPAGIDPLLLELLRAKTEKTPMLEVLESMKMLKEITGPEKEPEEKPFWEKLVMAAAPSLIGGLTGVPQQPVAQSVPVQHITQATPTEITPTDAMLQNYMVRVFLGKVLDAAVENRDPTLYADMITEALNDNQMTMLKGVLTQADWAVKLFGSDQRVAACMVWLTELKQLLLSDATDQQQPSAPTGNSNPVQSGQ